MSLSSPNTTTNPAKRHINWKAGAGKLTYWDKEAKQEVEIDRPFKFAVLDELHAVSGFSEQDNSGIWSNEVKDLSKQPLVIHTGAGVLLEGLYKDIKDVMKNKGGKYTKSIYGATEIDGILTIVNLKLAGAGFSAWVDFTKLGSVYGNWTTIEADATAGKKGATKFFMPIFTPSPMTDTERAAAVMLDEQLQDYISLNDVPSVDFNLERKIAQHEVLDHILTDEEEDNKVDLSEIPF